MLDSEISFDELDEVLSSLKHAKAPGPDLLTNEVFQNLTGPWRNLLRDLFNRILDSEIVPNNWANALMTMIFKKGDRTDPANYRVIALVNAVTKIFTLILKKRFVKWMDSEKILPESQLGFRKGRSCTDAVFILISALQLQFRHHDGREIFGISVDFKRAFDSVPHHRLWQKLQGKNASSKFINILISLYETAFLQVKANGDLSDKFDETRGVLQGESMSADLFIFFLWDFEEFYRNRGLIGLNIDGLNDLIILLYADDTSIFAHSYVDLSRKLKALHDYCSCNGLEVNRNKTNIIFYKAAGRLKKIPESFRAYNGFPLDVVNKLDFLGVKISSSTLGLAALNTAILKAKSALIFIKLFYSIRFRFAQIILLKFTN